MTDAGQRFAICLAIALAAHAGLLAAMTGGDTVPERPADRILSVTISSRSTTAPAEARIAALAAQTGPDRISRRAQNGAAGTPTARATPSPAQRIRAPRQDRITRFEMAATTTPPIDARRSRPADAAAEAESERDTEQRTRSARADPRAAYLQAWKRHIERRGSRHYPSELIAGAPETRLTLGVTLMANGRLHSVRILRSSGSTALDRAAQAIVRETSPFTPFPAALRADNPRLTFAYDWLFVPHRRPAPRSSR